MVRPVRVYWPQAASHSHSHGRLARRALTLPDAYPYPYPNLYPTLTSALSHTLHRARRRRARRTSRRGRRCACGWRTTRTTAWARTTIGRRTSTTTSEATPRACPRARSPCWAGRRSTSIARSPRTSSGPRSRPTPRPRWPPLPPTRHFHGLGLNVVQPNRLFGVSGVSWQSCLVGHTRPSPLTLLSLNTAPWRHLLLLIS